MNTTPRKARSLTAALLTFGSLVTGANGAIIAGTNNGDGTWTVGGVTLQFGGDSFHDSLTFDANVRVAEVHNPFVSFFRRATELDVDATSLINAVGYSLSGSPVGGTVALSDDNWLLLSLEAGESDWDTAIQISLDGVAGSAGDSIVNVWHDDAATNENVLAGVTSFNDIGTGVPEPSSTALLGLSCLALAFRRSRR